MGAKNVLNLCRCDRGKRVIDFVGSRIKRRRCEIELGLEMQDQRE
jgi:hypothetical protein